MSLLSRIAVEAARGFGILARTGSPTNVPASYLVVAGGGGGGAWQGGGGGAGGYLTSTFILSTLNTYSITVGAGGVAGNDTIINGAQGSNSVISGTGLTTVTSTGGGGGGGGANAGGTGGSGGGGGAQSGSGAGGSPTSGQGFAGGSASNPNAGGGGGAGEAGNTDGQRHGGDGLANSISGSSVTRAGGGSGGSNNGTSIAGGDGGGGTGTGNTTAGSAGTTNTGGGGGGGGSTSGVGNGLGGAGGSGVVIISYTSATPKFVGGILTTSGGNQIHTFTSSGTLSPLTPVTASYLVVAGGAGGGGQYYGGGGGAGGLLTSSTTLYSGATYIVTVGAGGNGGSAVRGSSGSNSVLSGTGLSTITSTGGGGGGSQGLPLAGASGGSGGGGAGGLPSSAAGGTGTLGQGNNGGAGAVGSGSNFNAAGGGGGGASAVGSAGATAVGGNGGAGTASSISGSSVTYAGGGGGGAEAGTAGTGTGGGGNGQAGTGTAPTAGTANLGGGGGGSGYNTSGGAGGSGVVIISYAGSQVFNGGLVTSSGGNTIHTFNATGALTPLTNNLTNSLRFRASASAYLNRTPTIAGNQQKWTWSAWVKLGAISLSSQKFLFSGGPTGTNNRLAICLSTSNQLTLDLYGTATVATTNVYRDPSAWYHMVIAFDTTQATAGNRYKFYVNGNQVTSFASTYTFTQNANYPINGAVLHRIADATSGESSAYFDGYMDDINFIDGQALEPYYFGNNDANGVWKPIKYTGMYGTNGFYLTFADTSALTTSSNVGLGKDTSGNGNYWATNNISITAGTTYDAMLDVPTNTSATVANYAVMNPLSLPTSGSISAGNLNYSLAGNVTGAERSTIAVTSGKWYWEVSPTGNNGAMIGVADATVSPANADWTTANGYYYLGVNGQKYTNNAGVAYGATWTTTDIIGVALDMDAGTLTFYKNNTSQGTAFTGLTGKLIAASVGQGSVSASTGSFNFGQRPFSYTPPTGFVALNTYNLPTPTILQGNKYMDATTYTGSGATQVVTNQGQFKSDLVWVKGRSGATDHALYDSVRGTTNDLVSNSTAAATTQATGLTAFGTNGFTVGALAKMNTSAATYVGWQWQAGQGSTTTGTGTGGITSVTQSVNATAGFSIVTYTGSGANGTVTHGLGVAPKMVMIKNRSSALDWIVGHSSLTSWAWNLYLNLTAAQSNNTIAFNSTAPTSSVFSVGTWNAANGSGNSMVAYCWAEIAGFSKFGSYTGNSSADGPFVYLGFRPKFLMIKSSSGAGAWEMIDTSRDPINATGLLLRANSSGAELNGTPINDILSNGFKPRSANGNQNDSGVTYIYMAFAENPFKNSNAR